MTKEVGWDGAGSRVDVDGVFSLALSWLTSAVFQRKLAQAAASN